jgi:hypothetical protein
MAQADSRRPFTVGARVRGLTLTHVGFVVDRVAVEQVSLRVLRFSPANITPPWLSISYISSVDEQRARWWLQFRDIVPPYR